VFINIYLFICLLDVQQNCDIVQNEIFGPVVTIQKFHTTEEVSITITLYITNNIVLSAKIDPMDIIICLCYIVIGIVIY
jgi:hypothetical protein